MIQPVTVEESGESLADYATVPIAFELRAVLDVQVIARGLGGFALEQQEIDPPCVKDYDADKGEGPTRWGDRWDISNWGIHSAFRDGSRVGGCVVAHDTPGVNKLEGRKDIAVLWDIRVAPEHRRDGIGSSLFQAAVAWTRRRSCRLLMVETQNINVPACRHTRESACPGRRTQGSIEMVAGHDPRVW